MSNPKFKVENYTNLGGINSKYSPHLTSPLEFLDIKNFDFQTPGSLTQRWGSTQYIGQTFVGKILTLSEYEKLSGASMIIVGATGGLWYGSTSTQLTGLSLTNLSTSLSFGLYAAVAVGIYDPPFPSPDPTNPYWTSTSNFYMGSSFAQYKDPQRTQKWPQQQSGNYSSIAYLTDFAFLADGSKFVKFDGTNVSNIGLPFPTIETFGITTLNGSTTGLGFHGLGAAVFYFSYVNNRGFESQIVPLISSLGTVNNSSFVVLPFGPSLMIYMTLTLSTPLGYGISAINIYSYYISDPSNASLTANQSVLPVSPQMYNYPYTFLNSVPVSGSTVTTFPVGTTFSFATLSFLSANSGKLPNPISSQYEAAIGFTLTDTVYTNIRQGVYTNYYPQFLEVYDNRLFCAGFSATPSTVWFSDVKEPEGYLPENSFEVRTNDADFITALQSYQTRLYIFKKNSFHVLTGDNPANFFVQEISPIYGCLNNRCVLIFENVMFFLDRKGVIQYTGSNINYASAKIQPIFDRMNYNAALTEACAGHDKLRNQVLFAIPIDGSTTNNITLVYDYIADAWTTHVGYNPSIFAEVQGRNEIRRLFCGDYSGRINWFSASFLTDNGAGISLSFKTRYLHDMGDSVQKQFRRLYVNADQLSATLTNKINMYQDYGSSIVLGTTLNLGAFQERIEYGISAKSLAFELITVNSTNSPLRIHGFTIESRMQRRV